MSIHLIDAQQPNRMLGVFKCRQCGLTDHAQISGNDLTGSASQLDVSSERY